MWLEDLLRTGAPSREISRNLWGNVSQTSLVHHIARPERTASASSRKSGKVSSHPRQASVMLCP